MEPYLTGIDHIYLSVTDFERSQAFYDRVMEALGLRKGDKVVAGEPHAHYVAPSFQLTIRPARSELGHDPYRAGLHHLCFQAQNTEAVDASYELLKELGCSPTPPDHYPQYHPEYYATFFEDPDGIRLEIVSRTTYRRQLVERWSEFDRFLNPLQGLKDKP